MMAKSTYHKTLKRMLAASALWLTPVLPAEAVDLIQSPVVDDHLIKLSDLFTDVGEKGETIVLEAPAPGQRGTISGYELSQIASEHDLDWERPSYIRRIYIERTGEQLLLDDVQSMLVDLIKDNGVLADIDVKLYGRQADIYLPIGYSLADIEFGDFRLNNRQDRFSVTLNIPTGSPEINEMRLSGSITEVRAVPVFNRMVTPGEIITKADITWQKFPVRRVNRNVTTSTTDMVGQTVRRAVSAGQLIRETDITMPVVISRGSLVSMTFVNGALSLTTQGRALEDGGKGDVIRVMNDKSNQTVEAKVMGPDSVLIQPTIIQQLAANN